MRPACCAPATLSFRTRAASRFAPCLRPPASDISMAQAADLHPPPAGAFDHFNLDFHFQMTCGPAR